MSEPDAKTIFQRAGLAELLQLEHHPDQAKLLASLATALYDRFQQSGWLPDLDAAILLNRNALEIRPEGQTDRSMLLNNLALALWTRFQHVGRISDLDEATTLQRSTLELLPEGHPNRSSVLNNLASVLQTRFQQLGRMSDLDEAITLHRNALELYPPGHPDRSVSLNNIASALQARFEQMRNLSDLHEAITLHRTALELYPERSPSLNNLATSLWTRFQQVGDMSDLDEAITLHRKALELQPEGHPDRSWLLSNLASDLHARFQRVGKISDLEKAIMLHRIALDLRPEGHLNRFSSLDNLALALETRFEWEGKMSDLDEAIALHRSALELCPLGHPQRSTSVEGVSRCLLLHPQAFEQHKEEAFRLYSTLSNVSQSVAAADLAAAQDWVQEAERAGHPTLLPAYLTSLRLLTTHLAAIPCLPQHLTVLKQRTSSLAVDAFSASIRHGTLTDAVELLEQGRGVFWNQLTRLRSPVDDVIASGDEGKLLGEKFLSVSRALRNILDSNHQDGRAWQFTNELQDIVSNIRMLPAHSRFLLSPHFSDLRNAAAEGPVVIVNASQYGCDALIVFQERDPIHIPLSIEKVHVRGWSLGLGNLVKEGKMHDVQRELVMLLRELWDHVVYPIVQVLDAFCARRSRIWWCPTAEFSLLPLHAAGEYRANKPNFFDLYLSSYTPTLTALIRSRRPLDSTMEKPRFVAVGNGETPGEPTLENVHAELVNIGNFVHTNGTYTCIEGQDAQVGKVGEELQQSAFVHFACHGIPNPTEPFESGFALTDGLLKVRDIIQYDLHQSRLATLSACHATVGDEDSPDEAIHLAAAMQFIGFRSVVGTMWAVDDEEAKKVMTEFYRIMANQSGQLDHTRSAVALHRALRAAKPPLYQRILFVHIGA